MYYLLFEMRAGGTLPFSFPFLSSLSLLSFHHRISVDTCVHSWKGCMLWVNLCSGYSGDQALILVIKKLCRLPLLQLGFCSFCVYIWAHHLPRWESNAFLRHGKYGWKAWRKCRCSISQWVYLNSMLKRWKSSGKWTQLVKTVKEEAISWAHS